MKNPILIVSFFYITQLAGSDQCLLGDRFEELLVQKLATATANAPKKTTSWICCKRQVAVVTPEIRKIQEALRLYRAGDEFKARQIVE